MRKLMAIILVTCLGILLPAAATPVRVCLLDPAERTEDCCDSCDSKSGDCCANVKALPSLPMPGGVFETPAFVGHAIPVDILELPAIRVQIAPAPCFDAPRTGIGPPAAYRAVLNVWRL